MNALFVGLRAARWRWALVVSMLAALALSGTLRAATGLTVTVTDTKEIVAPLESVNYVVTVDNSTGSTVTGATVDVTVDAGNVTVNGTTAGAANLGGGHYQWTIDLPTGPTFFVVSGNVKSGTANNTVLTTTASATYGAEVPSTSTDTTIVHPPTVGFSPASFANFGNIAVGQTSAAKTMTLTNNGTTTLLFGGFSIVGDFALSSNTCGASLAPGATCTVSVTFTPTATGARNGSLTISDNSVASPHVFALAGTGVAPVLTVTPTSINFGNQNITTTSAAQTITVKNTGSSNLSISGITLPGAPFNATTTCSPYPRTLAPNATCTITVSFAPTATGAQNASIVVSSDAGNATVALSGNGTQPVATFTPALPLTVDFGDQVVNTTSAAQTITLTNSGDGPLTVTSSIAAGATDFARTTTCGSTLAPGASCTFSVTFTPTSTGTKTGTLRVTTNAAGSPHDISLTGKGIAPTADLDTASLTFGNQPVSTTSAAQTVTLTNNGDAPLTISGTTISGDFARTPTTCVSPLNPTESCTINVTFTPTATGSRTGTLTFNTSAGNKTVALSGTGTAPAVTATPTSLDFGNVLVGATSAVQQVTVKNTGTSPLTISGVTAVNGFAASTNCVGVTLAVNDTCIIDVTFSPTAAGPASGVLLIDHNAAGGTTSVNLSGNGVAPAPAVSLSPTSLDFGNQVAGTSSAGQDVTLSNTGTADLAISGITTTGDYSQTNTCGATLAASASCTISVVFAPTTGGTRTGTLSVVSNAAGSPHTVSLTGTGVAPHFTSTPAAGALRLTSLIGSSNSLTITIGNSGNATLNLSAPAEAIAAPFSVSPTTAQTVAANGSVPIVVTCTPTDVGPYTQTLTYTTNDPAQTSAVYTITCDGTTTPTATYSSSPAPGGTLDFGDVNAGQSGTATLSISEAGSAALVISSASFSGADASNFSIVSPTFPLTINDGAAAATVTIACRPTSAKALTATLTLATNDPSLPTATYTLVCNGVGVAEYKLFMPIALTASTPADLVVENFTVAPTSLKSGDKVVISATVRNTGGLAAGGFWVDLYLNPTTAPTAANLPWNETCGSLTPCYGIAWYIEGLAPGASVTLSSEQGFVSANSNWINTLAPGTTDAYIYADSWNRNDSTGERVPTGAVQESNETNNRAEVHGLSVTGTAQTVTSQREIPVRPNVPSSNRIPAR